MAIQKESKTNWGVGGALALALAWGAAYALFLQKTRLGEFLAARMTWVTVVIGVGVDMLIALPLIPRWAWGRVVYVICFSSIGIIARSLINEMDYAIRVMAELEKRGGVNRGGEKTGQ